MERTSCFIPLAVLLFQAFVFFSTSNAAGAPAKGAPAAGAPAAGAAPAAAAGAAPGGAPGAAPGGAPGGTIDITTLGAKAGGDATDAMKKAWEQACGSTSPSKIVVPKGNYTLGTMDFPGPCKAPICIELSGNFEAPKDLASFKGKDTWIQIEQVDGLMIKGVDGGGVFDGNGEDGWKNNNCQKSNNCGTLPYNFRFFFVNDTVLDGITSLDSKMFHMNLINVYNFTVQNVKIIAPEDAQNTDGIHLGRCSGVRIIDTTIGTGDDCISLGDGTKNLTVQGVHCGPGHGISVGSLGRYDNEESVEDISVTNCTFKNTQNGIRIKSWLNSKPCSADKLHFKDITMDNVTFPLLVDQAYCPSAHCDASVPSKVKISDVFFTNIKGTANDPSVMRFVCSHGEPCENIHLEDIDLKYNGPLGTAVSECCNVKPQVTGTVNPAACAAHTTEEDAANHITSHGAAPGGAAPGGAAPAAVAKS